MSWVLKDALLGAEALDRIILASKLTPLPDVEEPCKRVLQDLAQRVMFNMCEGPYLSKRDDLEPILKAWGSVRATRSVAKRRRLQNLLRSAGHKGGYPIPSPKAPRAFEEWLADECLAHGIDDTLLDNCLSPATIAYARKKARRVAETHSVLKICADISMRVLAPRDLDNGGAPGDYEKYRRLEKLLALFYILFGKEPNASVADSRPRGDTFEKRTEDGGATARFIRAFETEIDQAIAAANIIDPKTRPTKLVGAYLHNRLNPRPRTWRAASVRAIGQDIDIIIERCGAVWKEWRLLQSAQGAPEPFLVRAQSQPIKAELPQVWFRGQLRV